MDAQQAKYPNLAKLAIDVLSIPAQSAEIERTFSKCEVTITANRNRICPETLQHLLLLRPWLEDLGDQDQVDLLFLRDNLMKGLQLTHIRIDEKGDNSTDTDGGQEID